MSYIERHKYLLLAFFALILVAGISGYQNFKIQDTRNNIQQEVEIEGEESIPLSEETEINRVQNLDTYNQTSNGQPDIIAQDIVSTTTFNIQHSTFTNPVSLKVSAEEYNTEFTTNTTVYELMQTLTAMSVKPFIFSGQDYGAGMGYFVTEINGIKNDPQAGKYWIYYVNGESAKVGISNYIINKGEIIEWKYENSF